MRPKAEDVDAARVLGFLGNDDVLYCSPACAAERGQPQAVAVDQDEYEALVDRGSLAPAVVCPVCGAESPLDAADPDDR
jgi:hypothetical protein